MNEDGGKKYRSDFIHFFINKQSLNDQRTDFVKTCVFIFIIEIHL